MTQRIYFDNNASTPLDPQVIEVLANHLISFGNPSSSHYAGQKVRGSITQARDCIATFLHCKPQEVIFTSGGSEGANMILRGVMNRHKQGHIISSMAEHSCVYATVKELEAHGYRASQLLPGESGAVTAAAIKEAICPDTKLIAIMAVNNETGVKSDIEGIANIALQQGIPLFVDGVALLGKEAFQIPFGVTYMSFSGHKVHAPTGIGCVYVRAGSKLAPLLTGGAQEFGRRGGTENILGILGFGKAIQVLAQELAASTAKMLFLRDEFEKKLLKALPFVLVNGTGPRICNVSNLAFIGVDGEALLMALDQSGVSASHGSACSSGSLEPSRILLNMGLPLAQVHSSMRFSFSKFNTKAEVHAACDIIIELVNRLKLPLR